MKRLLFALLMLLPGLLFAQVNISVQLPPAGFVQKNQLWNLVIVNNRDDIADINIRFSLQDAVTGETMMTANTGMIMIGKGLKIISQNDVQPVQYNYVNPDFSKDFIPIGSYVACYRVYHLSAKGEEPLGDECVKVNIDPLSPPLLNTPADTSEVPTVYPQFTWMPPAPMEMFTQLSYEISVCEIKDGQKPIEAMQYNFPVYTKSNINLPADNYSSSYTALEPGKKYAWQVTAVNGISYATKTEVWSFTIAKKAAESQLSGDSYVQLGGSGEQQSLYTLAGNNIAVKYYSPDMLYKAKIIFSDEKGNIIKEEKEKIVYGENYITFPLSSRFDKNKIYKITLYTDNNKPLSALFTIIR